MLTMEKVKNKLIFVFTSRIRHTRWNCDWSSDMCSSDLRDYASWVLKSTGAYAVKIVNPGGIELWKRNVRQVRTLDDPVGSANVTPRRILEVLADAANELGLPHPAHIHCNNLGVAGNVAMTLESM